MLAQSSFDFVALDFIDTGAFSEIFTRITIQMYLNGRV
jgi:hypothetical protein